MIWSTSFQAKKKCAASYSSHPPSPILTKKPRRLLDLTITIRKIPPHNRGILTAANNSPTVKLQFEHPAVCMVGSADAMGVWMLVRILGLLLGLGRGGGSTLGGTRDGVRDLVVLVVGKGGRIGKGVGNGKGVGIGKGAGIGRRLVLIGWCVGVVC